MLIDLLTCVVGLILLGWSADRFIEGAAAIARQLGVSPMLIGLTVIGIGTSAPEVVVSVIASLQDKPAIAVGNALGSNIANMGLVLGLTALIAPLAVTSITLRRELPLVLAVSALALLLCWDGQLQQLDGMILLGVFVATFLWMIRLGRRADASDPLVLEIEQESAGAEISRGRALLLIALGLVLLPLSSQLLVHGATNIATHFGVSELVIGLTIVAIGTSLPELAAALAGARRGEPDLVLGNVLGSNLFNLLLVLAVPGVIAAPALEAAVLSRDLPMMIGLTVAVLLLARGWSRPAGISRLDGAILLSGFAGYQLILAYSVFSG